MSAVTPWFLLAVVVVLWFLGLLAGFAGSWIILLLVVAAGIVLVAYLRDTRGT